MSWLGNDLRTNPPTRTSSWFLPTVRGQESVIVLKEISPEYSLEGLMLNLFLKEEKRTSNGWAPKIRWRLITTFSEKNPFYYLNFSPASFALLPFWNKLNSLRVIVHQESPRYLSLFLLSPYILKAFHNFIPDQSLNHNTSSSKSKNCFSCELSISTTPFFILTDVISSRINESMHSVYCFKNPQRDVLVHGKSQDVRKWKGCYLKEDH